MSLTNRLYRIARASATGRSYRKGKAVHRHVRKGLIRRVLKEIVRF